LSDKDKDKIAAATEGLPHNYFSRLHSIYSSSNAGKENALTVCDYVFSLRSEVNPSYNYRKEIIKLLCSLSAFFSNNNNNSNNTKSFKEITRQDLLSFLDSYRKPQDVDPLHKWIGT
jgi:hypothetical protein